MGENFFDVFDSPRARPEICQLCDPVGQCYEHCYMMREAVEGYGGMEDGRILKHLEELFLLDD